MANDLTTTTEAAAVAFSAQSLTKSTQAVLDLAFDHTAVFTAAQIAVIEPVAHAVPVVVEADERYIRQSIGSLAAALPSQDQGEFGSKLKSKAYQTMLAGCDERALAYACRRCLDELDWMPTIHQIKERMRDWVSPETVAISRARAILRAGRRAPEEGGSPVDAEQRARVNAFLRTRGLSTRFAADGSTYQEGPASDEQAQAA